MIRGIYIGATGMLSQTRRMDVVSNNLANVNTAGFKKDFLRTEAYPEVEMYRLAHGGSTSVGSLGYGTNTPVLHSDFSVGSIRDTNNPLDLALEGEGLFTLETPNGQRYTRNGHFFRDAQGYLVNSDGHYLLGEDGRIRVTGSEIQFGTDGTVRVDGRRVEQLRIVTFPPGSGVKEGDSLWIVGNVQEVASPALRQGAIEGSNVNTISEMVNMISILRAYEANQKVITTEDELLSKAVTEVGRT